MHRCGRVRASLQAERDRRDRSHKSGEGDYNDQENGETRHLNHEEKNGEKISQNSLLHEILYAQTLSLNEINLLEYFEIKSLYFGCEEKRGGSRADVRRDTLSLPFSHFFLLAVHRCRFPHVLEMISRCF